MDVTRRRLCKVVVFVLASLVIFSESSYGQYSDGGRGSSDASSGNSWDSNEWSTLPSWWPFESWDPLGSGDSWQDSNGESESEESDSWEESESIEESESEESDSWEDLESMETSEDSSGDSELSYSWDWSSEELCGSYFCYNGGACRYESSVGDYCDCQRGWLGDYCESEDPCYYNPCINGGSCENYDGGDGNFRQFCQCEEGYSGTLCEIEITTVNPCQYSPCLHAGSCVYLGTSTSVSPSQYYCQCPAGYSGLHCETSINTDPCESNPCQYGYCISKPSGFRCECDFGYNGTLCERDYLKPDIHCEAGLSYQLATNEYSKTVTWDLPDTWDNSEHHVDNAVTVWCNPPSGTTFNQGTRNVICYAVDRANNRANCSFNVQLSTQQVPEIYCIGDITIPAALGQQYATVSYPEPSTNNAASHNCWPASGSNFNIGENVVTCQAWSNGVSDLCNFNIHVRDLQKPSITCPDDTTAQTSYQASYNQVWFQPPQANDNSGRVDKWCEPAAGSVFHLGDQFVVCYAQDEHGNQETCSFEVEVYDQEKPQLSCPGRKIIPTEWDRATSEIWFSGEIQTWDNSEDYVQVVCDPREGFFGLGNTAVNCVATDQSGNSNDCSFRVTVYDDQAPSIICPTNMYVKRVTGDNGVKITWEIQAQDNADDSPSWDCGPTMDHVFQYGTTTVTCVAEDASNNRANCQFNVEVTDYDVPEIYCPENIDLETLPGRKFNTASWPTPTYTTGGSQEVTVTCDRKSNDVFEIGSHMVECSVENSYGISSACVFFVNVEDTEDPSIQCPTNQIIVSENGDPVTAAYDDDGPTFGDNSDNVNMYCNPVLDTAFDIGFYTIVCTAIDGSGNADECTFGIRVIASVQTDPCEGNTNQCNGKGQCITTSDQEYTCICNDGWSGQFCQDPVDPCVGDFGQCNGRGTCLVDGSSPVGYTCECNDNWTDTFCTDVIFDHCSSSPCDEDGAESCTNLPEGDIYECNCRARWSGVHCDVFEGTSGTTTTESNVINDGGDGGKGVNDAQQGLDTGIVIGAASGGLLIIIIVLIVVIVFFVMRNKKTKHNRGESRMPLSGVSSGSQDRRVSEAAAAKEKGLENPAYSTKIDSRYAYALPSVSESVQPSAPLGAHPPPPNMPPPAYTPTELTPKRIPPRLPSMNPSAIYMGGSVVLKRGGTTATYGGYECPGEVDQNGQDFNNTLYEEIDDIRSTSPPAYVEPYAEMGNADAGYMDLHM